MPSSSIDELKTNMSSARKKKAKTTFRSSTAAISLSGFLKAEEPIKSTKAQKKRSHRLQEGPTQSEQVFDSVQELQISTDISTRNLKGKARAISAPYIPTRNTTKGRKPENTVLEAIPVTPKRLKRFYEALVILYILGANRGEHLDEEKFEAVGEPSGMDFPTLRRSFLGQLAYLCDYDKGGNQTTAVALQQTPQNVIYWFASNDEPGVRDQTKDFLSSTLKSLVVLKPSEAPQVENKIFTEAVNFSSMRIMTYIEFLRKELSFVLRYLESLKAREDASLIKWLTQLQSSTNSKEETCMFCYQSRHSPEYNDLQTRSRAGAPCYERFNSVRHLIGRLQHTRKAVRTLIMAAIKLPHLFDNIQIFREKSSSSTPPPLRERNPSLSDIAARMCGDPKKFAELDAALHAMDQKHGLSAALSEQCLKQSWRPKVHAELLLLNLFWIKKFEFVEGDRYVACSKPACYCCYLYIQNHPGRFAQPACHNNNWMNWRPPDIYDAGNFGEIKIRENILDKMAQSIRDEAIAQIMERRGPAKKKVDSNTMISSVRPRDIVWPNAVSPSSHGRANAYSSDRDFEGRFDRELDANASYSDGVEEEEGNEMNEQETEYEEFERERGNGMNEQETEYEGVEQEGGNEMNEQETEYKGVEQEEGNEMTEQETEYEGVEQEGGNEMNEQETEYEGVEQEGGNEMNERETKYEGVELTEEQQSTGDDESMDTSDDEDGGVSLFTARTI